MHQRLYWLDYDPIALAVLVIGIGMIGLLVLSIWSPWKQGPEYHNPATRCVSRRGFSCGREARPPSRYGTRDRRKRCPSGPDVTLPNSTGPEPRHTLRPVAGFSFGRRTGRPLPRLIADFTMWLPLLWSDHHRCGRMRRGSLAGNLRWFSARRIG